MKDVKQKNPQENQSKEMDEPFDLSSSDSRALLIQKAGIDFERFHKTLELHIYTPL